MASETEFVNYKDFVESLTEASDFASTDKSVISNEADGPRCVRIPVVDNKTIKLIKSTTSKFTETTKNLVSLLPKESSSNYGLTFYSDEKNHVRITGTTDADIVDVDYELDGVVTLAAGS